MDQRAAYLLQILETIGSPLMSAITAGMPAEATDEAQSMAALLAKTVEASIELGNIMEINPAEAQDDTLRVALAGLASPLVAGQFARRGAVPESLDIKKITGALQAVLTFSDNFTPTPETVERLKNLQATGQGVDEYQTQIQYMQAFIPVIEAISAFPFGQAEAKLIMDVSDRLVKKSVEIREILLPGVGDEAAQKRAELGILRALTTLYSACHKAETAKVTSMSAEQQPEALSIDQVWSAFDLRAAMLEALAAKMAPGGTAGTQGGSGGIAPEAVETPAAAEQAAAAPMAPPLTPPASAPPAAEKSANPMSMFAKPKEGDAAQATPPTAEAPPAAPATETPPTTPPPEPPPAAQPPVSPPSEAPAEPSSETPPSNPSGSPMGFFKKSDDNE